MLIYFVHINLKKMPPKRRGRPPGSAKKLNPKVRKQTLKEKLIILVGNDEIDDSMIKEESLSNDDSGNFTNGGDTDDQTEIFILEEKSKVYNCKVCQNKNFKLKENYKIHVLQEHSTIPGSIPCKDCQVVCPNKKTLLRHILKAHKHPLIKCEHCSKKFTRQSHVLRHMAQKGCGKKMAKFPCEICHASFSRKDNLIVHLRMTHLRSNRFSCKYCQFSTKNFTKHTRHWHEHHAEKPNQFQCDLCGKTTSSRAAMSKHNEIHGEKKYACDVCGYSTHTVEVMRRHVLTHVEDKPYKCNLCKHSYIQRSQLLRHLETHTGFVCYHCEKRFPNKASLLLHNRTHKGQIKLFCPYNTCEYAKKEFTTEASYEEHLKLHSDEEKLFSCEVCRKQFMSEQNMRRHMSTHTLDRPRRCMYCVSARAYIRGMHLVRHVRHFHADVFHAHLAHVRSVLSHPKNLYVNLQEKRVTKSELESILNVLDAESERILEGCGAGGPVLYGGMQAQYEEPEDEDVDDDIIIPESNPLMSEEMLAKYLGKLLEQLIDADTLQCLGWPGDTVDIVLEKVIEQCGARAADRGKWTRVQRLRENAKHLFVHVVDDKNVARMLDTHTIDQIIKHILHQFTDDEKEIKSMHKAVE